MTTLVRSSPRSRGVNAGIALFVAATLGLSHHSLGVVAGGDRPGRSSADGSIPGVTGVTLD